MPATSRRWRALAAANSPNAPSTWTQAPCSCAAAIASVERIERAGVHVARPGAPRSSARPAPCASAAAQGVRVDPALLVDIDRLRGTEAQVPQRQVDGLVPLGSDEHAHPGRAGETAGGHVPAGAPQHVVACRGQAGEVRHRRSGDQADRALGGQTEQVQQPSADQIVRGAVRRGDGAQAAVLVPRAGQPVGCHRGWQRSADHESEEPSGRHRGQARIGRRGQAGRSRPPDRSARPEGPRRAPIAPRRSPPSRAPAASAATRATGVRGARPVEGRWSSSIWAVCSQRNTVAACEPS